MPHDRVRTNHDEISQIARLFGQEAAAVRHTIQALRQHKDTLQGGDWIGQAARKFFEEMDGDVLPTLLRLERALSQAQQVTGTIGTRLRQCEADAAHQLQDREAFTGQPVGGSGGSLPSTGGDFTGQPVGGSGGSLPSTGGDFTGQPVGGSGGSLPSTGGDFVGQPVGGSGGSLPSTGGDFTGQPVGGSGGSLPSTGGDFVGQPVGGSGGSLPSTGGDFVGQPVGGSGGSLPSTGGDFTGQPVGGSGGSLPSTGGDFVGQPVGGSGGSLPSTGGDFTGQPVGGSGGSLPTTDDPYSIGGSVAIGPISASGEISAIDGSVTETGTIGLTGEGHVLGSEFEVGLDPFGIGPMQSSVSGEGVLLGGSAGFGAGPGLVGGFAEGSVGSVGAELQLGGGEDGWTRHSGQLDIVSGSGFIGFHEGDYGVGGSLSSITYAEDLAFGTKNAGITFGGELTGPGADGAIGFQDNRLAFEGGVEGVGVAGGVGLNVMGWNVSLGGEAEVGLHFGGSIGKRTAIHLGPFTGVIAIGSAK